MALADGVAAKGRPAAVAPTTWSGFYFGVQSGYQWADTDTAFINAGDGFSATHDSAFVGVHMGVQHQFGLLVLGIEGNWLSTLRDDAGDSICPAGHGAVNCTNRLNDILSVGARVGWAAGLWMPYITGGYANARIEYKSDTPSGQAACPGPFFCDQASSRHDGWYLGAGFEWIVSPNWTVGLEYRHYEFEDATARAFFTNNTGANPVNDTQTDATVDSIAARVTWRWDRPTPPPPRPLK